MTQKWHTTANTWNFTVTQSPNGHRTSIQRWNLVKNWLECRQRDVSVILTLFYESWFNVRYQTSIQCQYNVCWFDFKSPLDVLKTYYILMDWNISLLLQHNTITYKTTTAQHGACHMITTLRHVWILLRCPNPVCIFNPFSTFITSRRWFQTLVQRLTNIILSVEESQIN